jgi:hypothetical protein
MYSENSALVVGERSASRLGRFTLGERITGTHQIRGWVGPRTGLDYEERRKVSLLGLELRPLGHLSVAKRCTDYPGCLVT